MNMNNNTAVSEGNKALIIGATGLVGSNLVGLLLKDTAYSQVVVFVRRSTGINHPKLTEYIVDFDSPDDWSDKLQGDVLFSAMGTTIKRAESQAAQYRVDYDYQYNTARLAAANGVENYVLVSAMNAKAGSSIFYSRMKGELEIAVQKLPFRTITLIRPGLLYGERDHSRFGEEMMYTVINGLNRIGLLRKMQPIHGREVAQAMIIAAAMSEGIKSYTGYQLFDLASRYDRKS